MKALLTLMLTCFTLAAQGVEVIATGYGVTTNEALMSAKMLASEYAAGTFITGHQEVNNGDLTEQTAQFNGGLLTNFVITNTTIKDGLYAVTIKADVDNSKVNSVSTSSVAPLIIAPQVEKTLDEYVKTHKMLEGIDSASPRLGVKVLSTSYQAYQVNTQAIYQLSVGWSPKWIDDVGHLLKVINRPVQPGILSFARLDPQDSMVCLMETRRGYILNVGDCYGVLELPPVKPEDLTITATVSWENGEKTSQTMNIPWYSVEHILYDVNDRNLYYPGLGRQPPTFVIYAKAVLDPMMRITYPSSEIRHISNVEFSIK
jgi:hypothetical protein